MADPDDPRDAETPPPRDAAPGDDLFDDDLIGFASAGSLRCESAAPPQPEPEPEPEPEAEAEPEADLWDTPEPEPEPEVRPASADLTDAPSPVADPEPSPSAEDAPAREEILFPRATRRFERPRPKAGEGMTADNPMRMALAIYGCLVAVPLTLGVSLIPALYLIYTTRGDAEGWLTGHSLYQMRTSIIGAVAGAIGLLTLPIGLGVFILSLTVIWCVVRGGAGLRRLLRREPIRDPRTWSLP